MKKLSNKILAGLAMTAATLTAAPTAQAGWQQIYSLPTAYAHFITSEGIHLMSDYRDNRDGGIYYSEDKCVTWTKTEVRDYSFSGFYEADGYVFAIGSGCRIGRSEDGGRTWDLLNYSQAVKGWVPEKALDETVCYAITALDGVLYAGDFSGGGILRSEDYGETWEMTDRESLYIHFQGDPNDYMDNFYRLEAFKGKVYAFGLYSVHAYVPEEKKWEVLPINSNCLGSVTVMDGIMYCGRATTNYNTETEYLLASDGEQWGVVNRPDTDDNNVRALGNDGKYIFSMHHGGPMYYSDSMGESWGVADGLPNGLYPLTVASDDDYVYTAVYSPIPSEKKSGLWRLPKSELQSTGIVAVESDKESTVRFDGTSLLIGSEAKSVSVMRPDGREVFTASNVSVVDLSTLPAGIYVYSVDNGSRRSNGKIVKR